MKKLIVLGIYFIVSGIIISGLFFHESTPDQILGYSYKYFMVLMALNIIFLLAIPLVLNRFINKNGVKELIFSSLPTLLLLILIYFFFHYRYYGTQTNLFDPYLQLHKTEVDFNSYTPKDYIIVALGGSTTHNSKLPIEDRYTTVLENTLKKKYPDKNIKVINAGMDWYTSKHSLINYTTYYNQLNPDLILVMHAVNDIYRSFTPPEFSKGNFKSDYSHFYGPSIHGADPPTFETYLFSIIKRYWFSSIDKGLTETNFPISKYKSLSSYKKYMQSLLNEIRQDSIKCVVIEQPSIYKNVLSEQEKSILRFGTEFCVDGKEYASVESINNAMKIFNESALNIADSTGNYFVHTNNKIDKSITHFIDDVHYTSKGSILLGDIVADEIIKYNIIH